MKNRRKLKSIRAQKCAMKSNGKSSIRVTLTIANNGLENQFSPHITALIILAILLCLLTFVMSPDIATHIAFALIQLTRLISQSS